LDVNNGAVFDGDDFSIAEALVNLNNGASATVCVTETVAGHVDNGASLTVSCGGDFQQVERSNGGTVGAMD
jgi:hypothetical protein